MKEFFSSMLIGLGVPFLMLAVFVLFVFYIVRRQRERAQYSPLTEDMMRVPAQQLEKEFDDLQESLFMGCLLVFMPGIIVLVAERTNVIAWMVVGLVALYGARKVWKVMHRAFTLRLAIDGEHYTGQELNFLMRNGAWVYHDIPYQYGNIDHIVVSTGGVFTVETKTYRKPAGERESSRQANVTFDGTKLRFPNDRTRVEPLEQARLHAKQTCEAIKKNLGIDLPVTPVVALPGWFVERTGRSDVWVINPKRGGALAAQVKKSVIQPEQAERIANYIESVARSVPAGSKRMDPDAAKYYDFWNSRRFEERKLGG